MPAIKRFFIPLETNDQALGTSASTTIFVLSVSSVVHLQKEHVVRRRRRVDRKPERMSDRETANQTAPGGFTLPGAVFSLRTQIISGLLYADSKLDQVSPNFHLGFRLTRCHSRKRFIVLCRPSSRCASAIQIVRPLESIAETQH